MPIQKISQKWKITSMEAWDQDYIDFIQPGYIEFKQRQLGGIYFGCIEADIDYRVKVISGLQHIEFSFEGSDEYTPISGRGVAQIESNTMSGRIFIHRGDESNFTASPYK